MKISIMAKEGNKTGVLISYIEFCKYLSTITFHIYSINVKNKRTEITFVDENSYTFIYVNFIDE